MKSQFFKLLIAVCGPLVFAAASASVVYTNGTLPTTFGPGTAINSGFSTTDSFTLGAAAELTSVSVVLESTDTPAFLQWSIGSSTFGSNLGSGTASLSNQFFGNGVSLATFSLDVSLGAGDYWLTLSNASSGQGGAIYWRASNGPSASFSMDSWTPGFPVSPRVSQYFALSTAAADVPEPATLALLALSLFALAASRRRRQ